MNKSSNKAFRYILYLVVIAILVGIDQFSKYQVVKTLKDKTAFVIIKDVFEFRYLENNGAAWGILGGKIQLFTIFTIILVILIIAFVVRIDIKKNMLTNIKMAQLLQVVLVVLTSGAIGNLIDRIRLSYVIDFVYFKLINFPVFNIADCYVVISTFAILLLILFGIKEKDWEILLSRKNSENK